MPVLVSCQCGKQLRVPDEYVGKRVKCTACGGVQTVKAAENGNGSRVPKQPLPKTTAYPAPAPSKPGVIRFECGECGKQMQARTEHAGRTAKCPACGVAVAIPGPEAEEIEEAEEVQEEDRRSRIATSKSAPRKKIALDEEEAEEAEEVEEAEEIGEDDEEDDRPRKKGKKAARGKKKGNNLPLLIGVGVGVLLLLVGGGVLLWYMLGSSSSGGSDLAFVPPDAQMFVAVQVAAVWNTPVVQEALRNLPADAKANLDEAEKKTGLKPADIERMLIVAQDVQANEPWVITTLKKPVDRKKLLEGMEIDPAELKHQNRTYHLTTKGFKKQGVHFVNDKLIVFGTEAGLKAALDLVAGPNKKAAGKLTNSLKLVDGRNQVVLGVIPPAAEVQKAKQGLQQNPMAAQYAGLLDLQGAAITANVVANTLQMEFTINYPGDAQAKSAKTSLDGLKAMAGLALGGFIQDRAQAAEAQKVINTVNIDQRGSDVLIKVSGEIKVDELMKMAGGAMGGPFGGPLGGAAGNVTSQNNLKQIGLAFHTYADSHGGKFPPTVVYNGNQKLHSWRVEILPYVEQQNLYDTLRGKSWISTKALAEQQMPRLFQIPNRPVPPGFTYYKLFTGPQAVFDDKREVKLVGLVKGTSNTVLAVEAKQAVFWTQPNDIPFNANGNPLDDLYWDANGMCNVLMADGSVRKIRRTMNPQSLKNAIMPQGDPPGPDF